jgi:hypothetical protein
MELIMNQQLRIPDLETSKRLLANLRRTRLELQETNLELADINARLADELREQRLQRVRGFLADRK